MATPAPPSPVADDQTLGREARQYLRARHAGVLSTISKKLDGYPYGSVLPFVLDHGANPVILISNLAEHTRNLAADPRASLIAHDYAADVQAGARLTAVGDAEPLPEPDLELTRARYLRLFPDAARLLELGDFRFWRLRVKTLRLIGGFGRIHWIAGEAYAPPANSLAEAEESIIAHMNRDHAHNIADYTRHYLGQPGEAVMVGIDYDGIDLRVGAGTEGANAELRRIDFERPVHDASEARAALVAMAKAARS